MTIAKQERQILITSIAKANNITEDKAAVFVNTLTDDQVAYFVADLPDSASMAPSRCGDYWCECRLVEPCPKEDGGASLT